MTLLEALKERAPKCFLCDMIREDLEKHGKLTDWSRGDGPFVIDKVFKKGAKVLHIKLERFSIDNVTKPSILSVD